MNEASPSSKEPGGGKRCPICRKPTDQRYRPFCSRRCADVDLHRWLSGGYAIPAVEQDDEAEELRDDGRADE